MMYTNETAIKKWLEGVTNAALSFRPAIYATNAVPQHDDIMSALQILSRLTQYDGFIDEDIEEMYTQQVRYALEHISQRAWNPAQCAAARDAITDTLSSYLHYDPAIGNGVAYQTQCFFKTLRAVDNAYHRAQNAVSPESETVVVREKVVTCCLTPYYKHTVIRDPDAQPSFKYKPSSNDSDEHDIFTYVEEQKF